MSTPATTIAESFNRARMRRDLWAWWVQCAVLYVFWLVWFGPLTFCGVLLYRWYVKRTKVERQLQVAFALLGLVCFVFITAAMYSMIFEYIVSAVFLWWFITLSGIPFFAEFINLGDWIMDKIRPRSLQETVEEEAQRLERQRQDLSRVAERKAQHEQQSLRGYINLGVFMKGDTFLPESGVHRQGEWIRLKDSLIDQHMLVLGAPGAGKSQTLLRLITELLNVTERDIFIVDGKGDSEFASQIASLIYGVRGAKVPIFRLGHAHAGAVYNAFQGTAMDVYNRLCKIIEVENQTGDASYYANVHRDLLQLICFAGTEPPRSFEEVRERLNRAWLKGAYKDNPAELETIRAYEQKLFDGLLIFLRPLIREFSQLIDPSGFSLETARHAVFSIRTQSVGDTAGRLVKFLIEDFKDYLGKRQTRPAVFIIDEFQAFGADNIIGLLSLARSAQLGIVLATQDTAGLGDERVKRLIMANARTKFLMSTDYPEDIAQLAGTVLAIEASIQHTEGDPTGAGSARLQHQFKIDMNEVSKLRAGEGFLIRQRQAAKVKVSRVNIQDIDERAEAVIKKPVKQVVKEETRPVEPVPVERTATDL